ncbi:HD domain-containing protein [Halovulum sp. GXIMD14793]
MTDPLAQLRQALRQDLSKHLNGTDPAHDLAHSDRVWRNAALIADTEGSDRKVLLGAAYLHDLVSLPKDHPDRKTASTLSAETAAPILQHLGFSKAEIAACQHAIAAHSFSAGIPARTPEAKILQDADRLDALGAIGIARAFAVSGQLARPLIHADDPFARDRALDDQAQSLDHFAIKLLRLPQMMQTNTGRKLAETRAASMVGFLRTLGEEIGHAPPEAFLRL